MREIKFRSWVNELKLMCIVERLDIAAGRICLKHVEFAKIFLSERVGAPTNDVKLMQYTGLKDKNGKEIYEGDIVKYCPNYRAFLAVDEIRNEIKRGVVVWNEQGFYAIDDNYPSNKDYMSYPVPMLIGGLEVIGNIYENLELLEKI